MDNITRLNLRVQHAESVIASVIEVKSGLEMV